MQAGIGRLVDVKQQRVQAAERLLRQQHERCEQAALKVRLKREEMDAADDSFLRARQVLLEDAQVHADYLRMQAAMAHSQSLYLEVRGHAQALARLEAGLVACHEAVDRARQAVQAACREREKTQRQHEQVCRRQRLRLALRQEAELEEFVELRSMQGVGAGRAMT